MREDGELLDDIQFKGEKSNSIFTDFKGHQGQIVIETGTLVWLNSIYHVDLNTMVLTYIRFLFRNQENTIKI